MKIAILYDNKEKLHSTNWSLVWENYCVENDLYFKTINPYKIGVMNQLLEFDIILWHYSNYSFKDMLMARNVLNTLENHGKKVFPSFKDSWHFDDKLAETYLLESIQAPIPNSYYFYDYKSLEFAINNDKISYPTIAKLRNGSGSHNVKKIDTVSELKKYSKKMFTTGLNSAPSLLFKASSNIKSSKSLKTFVNRAKRMPEFLKSFSNAKKFNLERGYVYLQDMIPNDGYDLKIVVIKDKLSFIGRKIRDGEYRASGSGSIFYDIKKVPKNIINSAFNTSDKLGFNCMGYDYVVDKNTGEGKIIEISYGFSNEALLNAGGYFDRKGNWFDKPLNAPQELLKIMINAIN